MPLLRRTIAVSRTDRGTLAYGVLRDGRSAILLNGVVLLAQEKALPKAPANLDEELANEYFRLIDEYHRCQTDAA